MKASSLKKCMLAGLILIAFVSVSLASGKGNFPKYFFDNEGAKVMAESQTICVYDENSGSVNPNVKIIFGYNENGRVIEKKILRWDKNKSDWNHSYCLKYTYQEDAVTIEFALWNKRKGKYDDFTERTVYKVDANKLTACNFYRKNSSGARNWNLELSLLINTPINSPWHENNGALVADVEK